MKRSLLILVFSAIFLVTVALPATASGKKETSHRTSSHWAKSHHSHVKTSSKKKARKKEEKGGTSGTYYVKPLEENLRIAPSGDRIGSLVQGATVTVDRMRGNWAHVTIRAWIWRPSLSKTRPKKGTGLLIGDVAGSFGKDRFVIKGTLNNQTQAAFKKVVIQAELFKGNRRVAYKTIHLFSSKKPLGAGKSFPFKISFKRLKGFDRYGVRILSALER